MRRILVYCSDTDFPKPNVIIFPDVVSDKEEEMKVELLKSFESQLSCYDSYIIAEETEKKGIFLALKHKNVLWGEEGCVSGWTNEEHFIVNKEGL